MTNIEGRTGTCSLLHEGGTSGQCSGNMKCDLLGACSCGFGQMRQFVPHVDEQGNLLSEACADGPVVYRMSANNKVLPGCCKKMGNIVDYVSYPYRDADAGLFSTLCPLNKLEKEVGASSCDDDRITAFAYDPTDYTVSRGCCSVNPNDPQQTIGWINTDSPWLQALVVVGLLIVVRKTYSLSQQSS